MYIDHVEHVYEEEWKLEKTFLISASGKTLCGRNGKI